MEITTVRDLIRLWPTQQALADDIGVARHIVRDWARGQSMIRAEYFNLILKSAQTRNIRGVSYKLLADLAEAGGQL